jgi:NTP pyrophosphatase (non-canonical NTP hydrolase)
MAADATTTIAELKERVALFAKERDWDQFHSPKNLSMALAVEVAELMELFQWKTEQESWEVPADPVLHQRVAEEVADIAYYVFNLCNRLDLDLSQAFLSKLEQNAAKYPANQVRGKAAKYTDYQ